MRLVLKYIALIIAALWLPMMAHCALDLTGALSISDTQREVAIPCDAHDNCPPHAHDTCELIESTPWLNNAAPLNAAKTAKAALAKSSALAPPSLFSTHAIFSQLLGAQDFCAPLPEKGTREHPQNWIPARHFASRSAPLPRAPSVLTTA